MKFSLCAKNSCCPEVEIVDNNVTISDDFGGKVTLSKEEVNMLLEEYPKVEAKSKAH